MAELIQSNPIDYLIIGHLTKDLTPSGERLGGTVAYAALTARALGLRVGIVTSWGEELPLGLLSQVPMVNLPADTSTTFENFYTLGGRVQKIHTVAHNLDLFLIPEPWLNAPIVHLAPVAKEVSPNMIRRFKSSFIGLTPQGWLREWDEEGNVHPGEWPEATYVLNQATAAVISLDDVGGDEQRIEEMAAACAVLAVTEQAHGVRLYWQGDVRHFAAPEVQEVDSTGAGDIFAAAFFSRLYSTRDPWEAARFATRLAAYSVTRAGLEGVPTFEEIQESLIQVL